MFIKKPTNIKNERPKPIEYNKLLTDPNLFSLKTLRIRIPGIKVRYIKQTNCLKRGILKLIESKPMDPHNKSWNVKTIISNFLIGQSFI